MILVTGGTGLVGGHLLYFLLKDHAKVRAIYRRSSTLKQVEAVFRYYTDTPLAYYERIEWVEADISNLPALTQAFSGITHVYHAAAYISFDPKNYRKLKKSNVEGTANVVNLCLRFGVEKLCYVSSVATLGNSINDTLITEETHWNPEGNNSVYAITKYGAEMEVWRGAQEGLAVVVVNPGVILGEGARTSGSGLILHAAARGIRYYTSGAIGIVDVVDVVKAMLGLMSSSISNERFILVGKNITYQGLLTELTALLGKKPPSRFIAKWKLMVLSRLDFLSSLLFGFKRRLPKATVDSLYTTSLYDASKVEKILPFTFGSMEETLARITSRYGKIES